MMTNNLLYILTKVDAGGAAGAAGAAVAGAAAVAGGAGGVLEHDVLWKFLPPLNKKHHTHLYHATKSELMHKPITNADITHAN